MSGRLALVVLLVAVAACDRDEVRVYTVEKSTPPATQPVPVVPPMMAGSVPSDSAEAPAPSIAWTVPAGWRQVPGQRAMRVATFEAGGDGVEKAEIVVSQFPGDVGGVLANVNRWRKQVELDAVTEADLGQSLTPFYTPTLQGQLMRLRGPKQHMLAALIREPAADRTWFVKATVSPVRADTLEADVYAFAKSFGQPTVMTRPTP